MTCHSAPMSPGLFLHSPLLGHSASLQAAAGWRHSGPLNPQQMALLRKNKNPSRPMNSSGDFVLATAGSNKDTPSRGPTPICKASSQPVPPNTARAPKQSAHRGRDLLPLLSRARDQASIPDVGCTLRPAAASITHHWRRGLRGSQGGAWACLRLVLSHLVWTQGWL